MRHYLLLSVLLFAQAIQAQTWDSLCIDRYRIDTTDVGALRAEVDALAFFQNNEFSSKIQKGYTLPGAWLQPKLVFAPLPQLQFEAGAHLLLFDGANRYPNYAYHDIAHWKGNQYQHGFHALPFFRIQADFFGNAEKKTTHKQLTLVIGNIYGAQSHELILPMFNPEQNLSADPEMGFQLLYDRRHVHLDTWLNWQSYIFKLDTHQEAFTVGMNWNVSYNKPESKIKWFTPVQIVIQHRGGEQNIEMRGVHTICNASLGVRMKWNTDRKALKYMGAEVNMLAAYQQSGNLWPFKTGLGVHAGTDFNFWNHLGLKAGYVFSPKHFVSLYGNPLFNTLSQIDQTSYDGNNTLYARVDYHYVIAKHYVVGAQVEAFQTWLPKHQELNFDFGLYLRVNPNILIKRW